MPKRDIKKTVEETDPADAAQEASVDDLQDISLFNPNYGFIVEIGGDAGTVSEVRRDKIAPFFNKLFRQNGIDDVFLDEVTSYRYLCEYDQLKREKLISNALPDFPEAVDGDPDIVVVVDNRENSAGNKIFVLKGTGVGSLCDYLSEITGLEIKAEATKIKGHGIKVVPLCARSSVANSYALVNIISYVCLALSMVLMMGGAYELAEKTLLAFLVFDLGKSYGVKYATFGRLKSGDVGYYTKFFVLRAVLWVMVWAASIWIAGLADMVTPSVF